MMSLPERKYPSLTFRRFHLIFLAVLLIAIPVMSAAQTPQLSLADLLIGLRSKKVPLTDRNKILADAVKQRGVTFAPTPEIERELTTTGANPLLLAAIRERTTAAMKPAGEIVSKSPMEPDKPAEESPADFKTYIDRAEANTAKGDFPAAIVDYSKSLELKPDNAAAYLGRGKANFIVKAYDKALADLNKAAELDSSSFNGYLIRGISHEQLGNVASAKVDYQKAIDMDASNETARAHLKRINDEEARQAVLKQQPPPPIVAPEPAKRPEFLNIGNLGPADAVDMVTPVYSSFARRANIEGRVVVEVEIDEKGNVTDAKVSSGHQMLRSAAEDAANRSRFKPATFDGTPIRAKGTVTYNFSLKGN